MEEIVIQAKHRQVIGKQVKALRREGWLPAIIYGHGFDPIPISLNYRESNRILPTVSSSRLVIVDIDGVRHNAVVRERQRHPVTGNMLHVDFQEVSMTEMLRTNVSLELRGEAPAVEEFGGIVVAGQEQIEIECLPGNLPNVIEVDISSLKEIGDALYVRDLPVPPNVEILTDLNELVVVITAPVAEPEEAEELETEEPEVIERGKREEEEQE
ncbi:MAG: 50S ribosomal protein L25 [Anaerolineales bacterium]|nr:50S ribosomal protein L25 [Anaerolineales bacterium]